jgi:hypothetical protein
MVPIDGNPKFVQYTTERIFLVHMLVKWKNLKNVSSFSIFQCFFFFFS